MTSATHPAAVAEIGARERGALAHVCRRCGQDDHLAAPTARRARSAGILRGIIGNDAVFRHVGHCGIPRDLQCRIKRSEDGNGTRNLPSRGVHGGQPRGVSRKHYAALSDCGKTSYNRHMLS